MDNEIANMLLFCSRIDFGTVVLSCEEKRFRNELNHEMLALCEHLPKSMQTKAALFLMEYLQATVKSGVNFVSYFYPPSWSILFWLLQTSPGKKILDPKFIQNAKVGHTNAMFLHALDDHLTDRQLPVTHLSLLMRSQSWMTMNQSFHRLSRGIENGAHTVGELIDDYYSSIDTSDETQSLDDYCNLFMKQMATWLIVPILLAQKLYPDEEYWRTVQAAYSSFGIAWRLLDDLQDLEKDMINGAHSSIYVFLSEDLKYWWNKDAVEKIGAKIDYAQAILRYVHENEIIDAIIKRACDEMAYAASKADDCRLPGLAAEFRCLGKPLKIRVNCS